jgi:hypothetical protein
LAEQVFRSVNDLPVQNWPSGVSLHFPVHGISGLVRQVKLNDVTIVQYFATGDSSTVKKSPIEASEVDENIDIVLTTNFSMTSRNVCGSGGNHYVHPGFTTKASSILDDGICCVPVYWSRIEVNVTHGSAIGRWKNDLGDGNSVAASMLFGTMCNERLLIKDVWLLLCAPMRTRQHGNPR